MSGEQSRAAQRIKASEQQISRFAYSLKQFADNAILKAVRELETGSGSITEAITLLGRLDAALIEAGLSKFSSDIQEIYGNELRIIRDALAKATGRAEIFSDIDGDIIQALVEFDTERSMRLLGEYTGDAKRVLLNATMAGEPLDLAMFDDAFGERFSAKLETELNTGLAGFSRSVNLYKADELGIEKFVYVGPDDKVIRPFCQERVGNTYTRDQIDEWDNGQGLPATIYLGGYNCRHRLAPIRG